MKMKKEITPFQVGNILFSSIVGPGLLPFPHYVAESGDTAAPLITLLGILITMAGLTAIVFLNLRYPGETFFRYSERIVGKWIAVPINLFIIFHFLFLTALMAREFVKVATIAVLENTPVEVSLITMLLMTSLSARHDYATFSYIHQFYTPFILFPVLFFVSLAFGSINPLYLQPILGDGSQGYMMGGIVAAGFLQAFFVIGILTVSERKARNLLPAAICGLLVAGGVYFMVGTVSLAVFGPEELKELLWPTLELAKITSLPGQTLERFDAIFLAAWVVATFTSLLATYYLAVQGTVEILRLRDHKAVAIFYLPYIYLLASIPKNVFSLYDLLDMTRLGNLFTIFYPMVLLGLAFLRPKGGRKGGKEKEKTDAESPAPGS